MNFLQGSNFINKVLIQFLLQRTIMESKYFPSNDEIICEPDPAAGHSSGVCVQGASHENCKLRQWRDDIEAGTSIVSPRPAGSEERVCGISDSGGIVICTNFSFFIFSCFIDFENAVFCEEDCLI